jgi:phosphoribosylformylglycinamidine synthase subunit PurS
MKAVIRIDLKDGVLDPQGKAVARALNTLGFDGVTGARQGKIIELDLDGSDAAAAHESVKAMCEKLLANTVIERYSIKIIEEARA